LGTHLFAPQEGRSLRWQLFIKTTWGRLYKTIPFQSLAALLPAKQSNAGAKARFSPEGMIALLILKHHMQTSDDKVIEHLNGNWQLQYFCGISLQEGEQILNGDILVRSRKFIGAHLDITQFDRTLLKHWSPMMEQTQSNLADATCIETDMRFPTDVKLLWESVSFLKEQLHRICLAVKLPMIRSKYKAIKKAAQAFFCKKGKSYKQIRRVYA